MLTEKLPRVLTSEHRSKIELKVQIRRMEAKCESIWSEESEMIAHLQSMFWSSSDADVSLSSPKSSTSSCVEPSTLQTALFLPLIERGSYHTVPLRNIAADASAPIANAVTGDKWALPMDESRKKSKNSNKKPRIVAPVSNANALEKFVFPLQLF